MVKKYQLQNKQKGAVLAISLFLLTILTIIGVSALTKTLMQEKLSSNAYNIELAFQASETSLKVGEDWLLSLTSIPTTVDSCTAQVCDVIWAADSIGTTYGNTTYENNWWAVANTTTDDTWWQAKGRQITSVDANDTLSYVANPPVFIIEELGYVPDDLNTMTRARGLGSYYYRITTQGTGGESSANGRNPNQIYLQSIFAKRYN